MRNARTTVGRLGLRWDGRVVVMGRPLRVTSGDDSPAANRRQRRSSRRSSVSTHPYTDSWECAACGGRLVPLTPPVIGDEFRPHLKCPKCGQSFRWLETADWPPLDDD